MRGTQRFFLSQEKSKSVGSLIQDKYAIKWSSPFLHSLLHKNAIFEFFYHFLPRLWIKWLLKVVYSSESFFSLPHFYFVIIHVECQKSFKSLKTPTTVCPEGISLHKLVWLTWLNDYFTPLLWQPPVHNNRRAVFKIWAF